MKVLTLRTVGSQLIRIGSSVLVARALAPEDFGVFAIIIYISGLGIYVQSLGLGAALVQQIEKPDDSEWRTAFLTQFAVSLCYVTLVYVFGQSLLNLFSLSSHHFTLLVLATAQPVLASFSFAAQTRLSRELEFGKIATASFANDLTQALLSSVLALNGFGIWTLVVAPTVGTLVDSLLLNLFCPLSPFGSLKWQCLGRLLRRGIPLQLAGTIPVIMNGWLPFYVSRILGIGYLGQINLSQRLASMPSGYLQILNQVAFPAFSRVQTEREYLIDQLQSGVYRFSLAGCIGYTIIAPWLPELVVFVYGVQWAHSGLLLQFLGMAVLSSALTSTLGAALNACGHGWIRVGTLVVSCGIPWLVAPVFIGSMGINGVGAGIVLVSSLELIVVAFMVEYKILPSHELRKNVFIVAALLAGGVALLATTGPQSVLGKALTTSIGLGAIAPVWWYENRIGMEPTVPWFFRKCIQKLH